MSFYCPVCNGMQVLRSACPNCHEEVAQDYGRFDDYMGPYSPYRPIDDLKMTNGFNDFTNHQCVHVVYCQRCKKSFHLSVNEWN